MPYALNVWIYECASNLNSKIAVKERNVIPRMCNWRVVSDKAKFEMLMSTIFQENACSNIVPTAEEIEAFDLAQLLRTYSRVSDTSPPPPPKRRKKVNIQKKKVSEQNQPDQSYVSPTPDDDVHVSMSNLPPNSIVDDVHGSVPDVSPKSAADVHGSVPDVSPNPSADVHRSADSQIEELKRNLKTYVDNKFEELIILIKANHSQLMQSIGKENINFQANTSTFQSDKQTSQQIPIDLSDMGGVAEDSVGFSGENGEHQIVDDAGDVAEDGVGVSVNEGEQLVSDTPKESSTSTTISPSTQAAIDALIKDLGKDPTNARPLYSYNPQNITRITSAHRNRMPSRRIQSPYCTSFGSSEKGKEKLKDMARLHFPFEGCGITDQVSPKLIEDYMNWLSRGLLKNHNNKYYMDDDDDSLTTQEHVDCASVVSVYDRSIIDIIKGFGIPAALPWHLVDEVYIPINCDQEFHWVLAVVELKNRVRRVFDSSISTRKKAIPHEIKMLSKMLPSYLLDSGFFEENECTKFADCHAYKDNITGSLLEPQVPFMIEFAQDIPKQDCDSLDCGLYVTAFTEYMSDQINISYADFSPDYLCQRYGALLWSYGSEKAKCGYVSDNDDPPKSRGIVTPPPEEDLVHIV
ncbi:uncharacterized protein [Solanum lycopersicum]|uniref:uncharacterized protein n=1 Tax=Solanum lycopersicum TaxID=4081 RepID=UPI0037494688